MAGESAQEMARRAREKAARLQRQADRWERGSIGEQTTGAVLGGLPDGWFVMHDVRWPGRQRANLDHVVVGPGGVFVVDTKNWSGRVTLSNGALRQDGRSLERTVASAAEAGLAVGSLAGPALSHAHAVLCFVDQPDLAGWSRDVMVCCTGNLLEMLRTRPEVLTPDAVSDTWHRLAPHLRPAVAPPAPVRRTAAPPRGPADRRRPRMKRRGPALGRALVGAAVAIGVLTVGPQLLPQVADRVGGLVVAPASAPASCPRGAPDQATRSAATETKNRHGC